MDGGTDRNTHINIAREYLFIYEKGPESATDMPMTVSSKLIHYKIRQISTGNKRFKNRQTVGAVQQVDSSLA